MRTRKKISVWRFSNFINASNPNQNPRQKKKAPGKFVHPNSKKDMWGDKQRINKIAMPSHLYKEEGFREKKKNQKKPKTLPCLDSLGKVLCDQGQSILI